MTIRNPESVLVGLMILLTVLKSKKTLLLCYLKFLSLKYICFMIHNLFLNSGIFLSRKITTYLVCIISILLSSLVITHLFKHYCGDFSLIRSHCILVCVSVQTNIYIYYMHELYDMYECSIILGKYKIHNRYIIRSDVINNPVIWPSIWQLCLY